MKYKKKLIITTSIILGVLVVIFGITYSIFTFNQTGVNSQLVLGDIWMKYAENNQLMLSDAMPMNINNYTTYKVNPEMANQEIEYVSLENTNELTVCVSVFSNAMYGWFDPGSDAVSYCKGTGTIDGGLTFQGYLKYNSSTELGEYLIENNVIILSNGNYIVNPEMSNQEVIETKEVNTLTKCYWQYSNWSFDEGSTVESFCKGTGTIDGLTIQEYLDNRIAEAEEYGEDFFKDWGGQGLLDMEIVIQKIENLPYFEFTISGKHTYTKEDIWYEIVLTYGDDHDERTTRIRDDLLRFSLAKVESAAEIVLFNNRSYPDLSNKRIWVETINANTTSEVNNKYRLYMWISEDTVIGNVNQDYTLEEWNDVFASIKVGVNGDFEEKIVETDGSCFDYEFAKIVNPAMASQDASDTSTELYKCISEFENKYWYEGETAESFCKGTGTLQGYTFEEIIDFAWAEVNFYSEQVLIDNNILINSNQIKLTAYDENCGNYVVLPKQIDGYDVVGVLYSRYSNGYGAYGLFSEQYVNTLVIQDNIKVINPGAFANSSNLTKVVLPDTITAIGANAFYSSTLTSIDIPDSVTFIGNNAFRYNLLTSVVIPDNVTAISPYAFLGNGLISVKIPDSVKTIGTSAFAQNNLTSVEIPNSVTTIGDWAFSNNLITSLTIDKDSNLKSISSEAFANNQLKTVTIGSEIEYIGNSVFTKSSTSNPNLESITFTSKTCDEIKNINGYEGDTWKYFPWLYSRSPYYQEGYKADIIGTDGICSY